MKQIAVDKSGVSAAGASKGRIEYIDLAKGICIMLVVLSHVLDDSYAIEHPMQRYLEPIRMPLYFILSGLFFKPYDGWLCFVKKKVNKILIPYLSFLLLYMAIDYWLAPVAGDWARGWGAPLWFLLCLFMMNMGFCTMRVILKNDWLLYASVLVVGVVGSHTQWLPLQISPATTCLPFFAFGYWLRNKTDFLTRESNVWFTLTAVAMTALGTYLWGAQCVYCANEYEMNLAALYFCGMVGTVGILLISKHLGRMVFVSYVGRYSLIVLVTHYVFLKSLRPLVDMMVENMYCRAAVLYMAVVCCSALMIYPLKRFVPYIVAQKDVLR